MAILGSLLSGLGAGLRAGGGVLNQEVFAQNEQRRAAELQRADTQRSEMFKYVWSGMQDGSIDPQKGMQVLGQLDPQMAGQIAQQMGEAGFQPSYAAREKMLTAQREATKFAREEEKWAQTQETNAGKRKFLDDNGYKGYPLETYDEVFNLMHPKPTSSRPSSLQQMLNDLKVAREKGDTEAVSALTDAIHLKRTRAPVAPQRNRYGVLTNDQGMPTGFFDVGPNGNRVEMFPGYGGEQSSRVGELPPVPSGNIERLAKGTGPGPAIGRAFSKTVGALLGLDSNATRDQAQARYSTIREQIYGATRVPGARSNMNLTLALEKMPSTGFFENQDRSETLLTEVFGSLRKAHEEAVKVANNPNVQKKIAVAAAEQAEAIKGVFDTLSLPMDGRRENDGWKIEVLP